MILEIISKIGGAPLRIEASQLMIRNEQGTPLAVAGEYGNGAVKVAHALDRDFQKSLQAFGFGRHRVEATVIESPAAPHGAKLLVP